MNEGHSYKIDFEKDAIALFITFAVKNNMQYGAENNHLTKIKAKWSSQKKMEFSGSYFDSKCQVEWKI